MQSQKKLLLHAIGVAAIACAALLSPVAQSAERHADDDFHENLLVSYAVYSDWPQKDRIQYMAEWRRAWTNFELGLQQRGRRFAENTRGGSRLNFLAGFLVPESWSDPSRKGQCLVGGWREDLTPQNRCPTRGHPCGDPADEGFECSAIYSHACVEREPIATLSRRCSDSARDVPLSKAQYNERRHALEDLLHDCQTKAFPPRFNDNCQLLLHDAKGIIQKSAQRTRELAPQSPSAKPKYCENNRVVRVYKSMGGASNLAMEMTRQTIAAGDRVEIIGECSSACIDFPAMVPKERVCVKPQAKLGFHLYTLDPYRQFVTRAHTNWVFSHYHPEIRNWLKTKKLTTELQYLQGPELRSIFQSCDDLYAACRSQNGPDWRPSKRQPRIVPESIE